MCDMLSFSKKKKNVWYVVNNAGISMLYVWICYCYGDEVTIWLLRLSGQRESENCTLKISLKFSVQSKGDCTGKCPKNALRKSVLLATAVAFAINASSLRIKMLILSSIITINY